jgi:hypothetical protein
MLWLQIPVTFSRTSEKQSERRAYKNKEYSYKYMTTGIYSTAISASSWWNLKSKTCFSLAMQQDRMGGRNQQSAPYSYYWSRLFFSSLPTKVMCYHQYGNRKFYTRSKSPVMQQGKRRKKKHFRCEPRKSRIYIRAAHSHSHRSTTHKIKGKRILDISQSGETSLSWKCQRVLPSSTKKSSHRRLSNPHARHCYIEAQKRREV